MGMRFQEEVGKGNHLLFYFPLNIPRLDSSLFPRSTSDQVAATVKVDVKGSFWLKGLQG